MDEHLEQTFLQEVVSKSEFASDCIGRLNRYLQVEGNNSFFIFECIYSFLNFSANVSLILWPSPRAPERSVQRGTDLRAALDVDDDNPLRDRALRNHFVHMDERLDEWWENSERRNIVRQSIGPRNMIYGIDIRDMFEHYVPDDKVLIFRGEEYDIQRYFAALSDVRRAAYERIEALRRR
jgi:hypothetical protein